MPLESLDLLLDGVIALRALRGPHRDTAPSSLSSRVHGQRRGVSHVPLPMMLKVQVVGPKPPGIVIPIAANLSENPIKSSLNYQHESILPDSPESDKSQP